MPQFLSSHPDVCVDDGTAAELIEFNDHLAGAFPVHVTVAVQRDVVVDFCNHNLIF